MAVALPALSDPFLPTAPALADDHARGVRALSARFRSAFALPTAAAALVAAAAHVPVTPQHLDEVPYVGWMFVALTAVLGAGALVLAVRDLALVWWGLAASSLAALVLYAVSRGPGMPGMADDIGAWTDEFGLVSVTSELLVVVFAVLALARSTRLAATPRRALIAAVPIAGLLFAAGGYALGVWVS